MVRVEGKRGGGEEGVRGGVDEAGADDVFDEVAIVKGSYLADDEAGGEEDGAEDVEAR